MSDAKMAVTPLERVMYLSEDEARAVEKMRATPKTASLEAKGREILKQEAQSKVSERACEPGIGATYCQAEETRLRKLPDVEKLFEVPETMFSCVERARRHISEAIAQLRLAEDNEDRDYYFVRSDLAGALERLR